MAVVYRARDVSSGTAVALKRCLLPADARDADAAARHEADLHRRLSDHPNIVTLYGREIAAVKMADKSPGIQVILMMELCEKSLVTHISGAMAESGHLAEDDLLTIFASASRAVGFLHSQQPPLVHRDIKPENMLLASDGLWKLCDFGSAVVDTGAPLATPQERAAAEADVARNTTPAYRAPEMWDVHRWSRIGRPADVWALGCLLYQLCFTRLPFGAEAKMAALSGKYQIPKGHGGRSAPTVALIAELLTVEPGGRPSAVTLCRRAERIKEALRAGGDTGRGESAHSVPPTAAAPGVADEGGGGAGAAEVAGAVSVGDGEDDAGRRNGASIPRERTVGISGGERGVKSGANPASASLSAMTPRAAEGELVEEKWASFPDDGGVPFGAGDAVPQDVPLSMEDGGAEDGWADFSSHPPGGAEPLAHEPQQAQQVEGLRAAAENMSMIERLSAGASVSAPPADSSGTRSEDCGWTAFDADLCGPSPTSSSALAPVLTPPTMASPPPMPHVAKRPPLTPPKVHVSRTNPVALLEAEVESLRGELREARREAAELKSRLQVEQTERARLQVELNAARAASFVGVGDGGGGAAQPGPPSSGLTIPPPPSSPVARSPPPSRLHTPPCTDPRPRSAAQRRQQSLSVDAPIDVLGVLGSNRCGAGSEDRGRHVGSPYEYGYAPGFREGNGGGGPSRTSAGPLPAGPSHRRTRTEPQASFDYFNVGGLNDAMSFYATPTSPGGYTKL